MPTFAEQVQQEIKRQLGLEFSPFEAHYSKSILLLERDDKKANEWIQIMRYKGLYSLSWAMPFEKANLLIPYCNRIEFDKEDLSQSRDRGIRYSLHWRTKGNHSSHLSLPRDILWHLVLGEKDRASKITVKWILTQMKKLHERM